MTAVRVLGLLASMIFIIGVFFVLAVGPSGHDLRTSIGRSTAQLEADTKRLVSQAMPAKRSIQSKPIITTTAPKPNVATSPKQPVIVERPLKRAPDVAAPRAVTRERAIAPEERKVAQKPATTPKRVEPEKRTIAILPQRSVVAKPPNATTHRTPATDRRITYKANGRGWKVESGYEGGNIFWEKTKTINGKRKTVRFVYPPSERRKYDRMIANVDSQF